MNGVTIYIFMMLYSKYGIIILIKKIKNDASVVYDYIIYDYYY